MTISGTHRFVPFLLMSIQVANKDKGGLFVQFLNVTHGRQETIVNRVIKIGVAVKTKDMEIIKLTTDSDDLEFMTGTYIYLFDCSRKPRPNIGC